MQNQECGEASAPQESSRSYVVKHIYPFWVVAVT